MISNDTTRVSGSALPITAKTSSSLDPIIVAIEAYHAGNQAFKGCPDNLTEEEERALIAATYGPADDALRAWDQPAQTIEGAVAALKLAQLESHMFGASDVITSMINATLGFFEKQGSELPVTKVNRLAFELSHAMVDWCGDLSDGAGRPDLWKAHIFPASMTKWPVSFEHVGPPDPEDRIDILFHEWRNMRNAPILDDTGEQWEAHCARYSELQRRIEKLEPRTVTDLAMQYYALTDDQSNELSDEFEKRIYRMAGVDAAGAAS